MQVSGTKSLPLVTLILGGARSGKSVYAERLVENSGLEPCYLATATSGDEEMAERIRYHALEEGLLLIVVKNYVRFCPPLIASHEELDDMVGRLDAAIAKAELGLDIGTDLSASGSLATNNISR